MTKEDRPDRERYRHGTAGQFETEEVRLGPWTSYSLTHDPKHLSFALARYKFCAKMLGGLENVVEVGSGDGPGLPIVAQAVGHLYAVDWDQRLLDGNARRLSFVKNVTYLRVDLNTEDLKVHADGAYTVDVLEHIEPASEGAFIERLVRCLGPHGVLITGTPNVTAAQYASPQSKSQHINLKTMDELRSLMSRYFHNVFMFGMNDEVLHTGYAPMCQYLWSVAVGVREEWAAGS